MKTSHPLRKLTTGLLCLVLNAAASGATREQADLGWRTWCELRPYGITQRLPLQEHRVYYTGLIRETGAIAPDSRKVIRETDAIPHWDTVSVSRDGKPLTRKRYLDGIDGPDQFVVDPRVMKIYVSGYTPGPYRASYQSSTPEAQAAIVAADQPILRRGSVARRQVPLIIDEPAGVDRRDWPITFGVPLPVGELAHDRSVLIRDSRGQEIPCQVDTTGYWADGSVKWLTVDFQATVETGGQVEYQLEYGNDVERNTWNTPLAVRDGAETVEIDTGPIRFSISKRRFNLFERVCLDLDQDGQIASGEVLVSPGARGGAILVEPKREAYYSAEGYCVATAEQEELLNKVAPDDAVEYVTARSAPESVEVEVAGPMRAVVRARGWHAAESGAKLFKYDVRYHAYAGSPMVRVYYTFTNAQDDQVLGHIRANIKGRYSYAESDIKGAGGYSKYFQARWRMMKRLALALPLHLDGGVHYRFGGDGDETHEGHLTTPPVEIYQGAHDRFTLYSGNRETGSGRRMAGWMDLSNDRWGLTIAARHAWQQFPKSFIADDRTAILELWSGRHDRSFEAFRGVGKRHELLFYFHPGGSGAVAPRTIAAGFEQPLIAPTPTSWVEQTRALGELGAYDPDLLRQYESSMDVAATAYTRRRREELPQRHYGMRDYGDSFCGAYRATMATGGTRGDNYWDDPGGNAWLNLEYDGTLTFLHEFSRRGDRRFFHEAEIAGRHWMDIDQCHYPPSQIGGQHVHGPQGMGYKPQSGGGHAWVEGLLAFGHLFADPRARQMGLNHGSAKLRQRLPVKYDDGTGGITQMSREYGWPALAFLSLYADTWDQRYLEPARFYVETFLQVPEPWPYYGAIPHLVDSAQGWMIQVVALPIIEYYRLTGDKRFARAITLYAERILSEFHPTETRHGGFTWVIEALAVAYEITGDDRYLTRAVDIFNNQTFGRRESKEMNLSAKRIPGGMAIMRRWCPAPSLALPLDPRRSEATCRLSTTRRPAQGRHALRAALVGRDGEPAEADDGRRVEKFELSHPMWLAPDVSIESGPNVSGGDFVRFGAGLDLPQSSRITAHISKAGTYQMMVRARRCGPGPSLMMRVDSGEWLKVTSDVRSDAWRWFNLSASIFMSAGEHEVQFKSAAAGVEADLLAFVPAGRACVFVVPGGIPLPGDAPATVVLECVNPLNRRQVVDLIWKDLPPGLSIEPTQSRWTVPGEGQASHAFALDTTRAPSTLLLDCDAKKLSIAPGERQWVAVTVRNRSATAVRGRIEWTGLPDSLRPVPIGAGFELEPDGEEVVRLSVLASGHSDPGSVRVNVRASCSAGPAWTRGETSTPLTISVLPASTPVMIEAERPVFHASNHYIKPDRSAYDGMFVWAGTDYYCVYDFQIDKTADYHVWARLRWPGADTPDHRPENTYTLRFLFDEADPPTPMRPELQTDAMDPPQSDGHEAWHWTRGRRAVRLEAGKHFLSVGNYKSRNRETDRYVITDDPNWRPPADDTPGPAAAGRAPHANNDVSVILKAGDAHVRDSDLVFHESFEGPTSVRANGGAVAGGAFVRGLAGRGYVSLANTKAHIRYRSIENIFPVNEGTIEFWVRPNWGAETATSHQFVRAGAFLVIERHESGKMHMVRGSRAKDSPTAPGWKPGHWHHVAFVWHDDTVLRHIVGNHVWRRPVVFYLDGERAGLSWVHENNDGVSPPSELLVGNSANGDVPGDAVFDELCIWKKALSPRQIRRRYEAGLGAVKDSPTAASKRPAARVPLP